MGRKQPPRPLPLPGKTTLAFALPRDSQPMLTTPSSLPRSWPLSNDLLAQVEFIQYLQTQRNNLVGEVFRLRKLVESGGKDGDAPLGRDDAEHLLAAGEQQQRVLRAETDTLKRENESAWKLMAEKVEEIHRLKELLERQGRENVRLRATLEEWSRWNANLDHRPNKAAEKLQ